MGEKTPFYFLVSIIFNRKELIFEMDPFEWELVRCENGQTKVRIIVEKDDEYKD
jgi:hypothetical protein